MTIQSILKLPETSKVGITTSSQFSEQGGSPTFDLVPFRVEPGKEPKLNSFVVIMNNSNQEIAHYGRIISGIEINARANPQSLQQSQAFNMPSRDIRPSDQSPDLMRIMSIEVLGEVHSKGNKFEVREAFSLPQTAQEVYEITGQLIPQLLNTPKRANSQTDYDGLFLGHVEAGAESVEFLLPNRALARHIAILGKTGVGKSYAAGVLIEELYKKDIPVIAFDVLGDTRQTAEDFDKSTKGSSLSIQAGSGNFKIPYYIIGWAEFSQFITGMTSDQSDLISAAYEEIYRLAIQAIEHGKPLDPDNVSSSTFENKVKEIGTRINSKAKDNASSRLKSALERSRLLTDKPVQWDSLLKSHKFINVYIGHLSQFQRNLVVASFARVLQTLRRSSKISPFVMLIDEAHFFLPGGSTPTPSTSVIREMIRTARHDSIGIILLSQSPSSMDKQALMTCNTRIIFALDPDDLRTVAGHLGDLPQQSLERIPRMSQGRAVISSGVDIMRHPIVIRVRKREITEHPAETPDLASAVQEWRKKKNIGSLDDQPMLPMPTE